MKKNNSTPPLWICEEQIPTPQTKEGLAPCLTATYEHISFANLRAGHFPRMGVIEIGHYEEADTV